MRPTRIPSLDVMLTMLNGKKGVFRPAPLEYLADALVNWGELWRNLLLNPGRMLYQNAWASLFPARLLVPDFPDDFFEQVAAHLADPALGIGIAFNSYNPRSGEEYVYLNGTARRLLKKKHPHRADVFEPGHRSEHQQRRTYQDIDAQAVRSALWLYYYGFDRAEGDFLDGAYYRDMILAELTHADTIFAVRPICHHWIGDMPRCLAESEDLKTEVGFNGAYAAERGQILLVNKLLRENKAWAQEAAHKYHPIELIDIEVMTQRGYFDYMREDLAVFKAAYDEAEREFKKWGYHQTDDAHPPKPRQLPAHQA